MAIERRLPQHHPQMPKVKELIAKNMKGFRGEQSIEYPLSILPEKEFFILHHLWLHVQESSFQIDTLIISPKFIMLLEVKNMGGTIYFDRKFNQMIQTYQGNKITYQCPIIQVNNQKRLFAKWLEQNNFTNSSLCSNVVISNPSTLIQVDPSDRTTFQHVIQGHFIPTKVEQQSSVFNKVIFSTKDIKRLFKVLLKQHKENIKSKSLLTTLDIRNDELQSGVQCESCLAFKMMRLHSIWFCNDCQHRSKTAHIPALIDFCLLHGEEISNKQARDYLQIYSKHTIKRILQSLNLPTTGTHKSTQYHLTPLLQNTTI